MKTEVSDKLIDRLREEIQNNLTNEQFGVEVLAANLGMSRSQLHRRINGLTGQSVSQFIREYRLELAMDMLREGDYTAAEVAHRVGFGSPTYFSKCFTEYYGYPPGETKHRIHPDPPGAEVMQPATGTVRVRKSLLVSGLIAFLIVVSAIFYFTAPADSAETMVAADRSVAILPFRNLGGEAGTVYFSEGVVEAVHTDLSKIKDLRVISRTSVEQYRDGRKPAREIARELGVATLLEGSVQRSGDRVRIDVRLIDGVSEGQLWAETYDRQMEDVFAIQRDISRRIASELDAKLSPEEMLRLAQQDTRNPRAYDLYLQGVYEYRTYTNSGAHNAIKLLSQAIALDSMYARAYAFLANSYIGLATIWGAEMTAVEALEKGRPLVEKALEIDPALEEAHMLMGFYRLYHDWDFEGAESYYKRGIASDHPDGLAVYIDYLNFISRHQEALALSERMNALDPYYPNSRMMFSLFFNGKIEEALRYSESRLKIFSNYNIYDGYGFLLLNTGQYKDAIHYFEKAIALEGIRYPRMLGWMGAAYARGGNRSEAIGIIRELEERLQNKEGGSISFFIAVIHSALGENDKATAWLEKAYDNHDMEMPWLMTEPQFYSLHADPSFKALAARMGFK